jgi:hypothetical protein
MIPQQRKGDSIGLGLMHWLRWMHSDAPKGHELCDSAQRHPAACLLQSAECLHHARLWQLVNLFSDGYKSNLQFETALQAGHLQLFLAAQEKREISTVWITSWQTLHRLFLGMH